MGRAYCVLRSRRRVGGVSVARGLGSEGIAVDTSILYTEE